MPQLTKRSFQNLEQGATISRSSTWCTMHRRCRRASMIELSTVTAHAVLLRASLNSPAWAGPQHQGEQVAVGRTPTRSRLGRKDLGRVGEADCSLASTRSPPIQVVWPAANTSWSDKSRHSATGPSCMKAVKHLWDALHGEASPIPRLLEGGNRLSRL